MVSGRLLLFVALCHCAVAVQVTVKQGILEGTVEQLVTGDGTYYSFKGIPYAAPPIGDLRFRAPQSPLSWTGVRNASAHGSVCTQSSTLTGLVSGTEDCLFLNVYTNNLSPKTPRAVMVWIHGGGYNGGSGNVANYGPDFLVPFDVIVVTMNYRLDALGFLSLGTKDMQGNAGLKDQVAALKWVQSNIASFGGDPQNVTLIGESVGGASVTLHMLSPLSTGLFQKAVAMSGSAFNEWIIPFEPPRKTFAFGKLLGLDTEDAAELITDLKGFNASQLVGFKPTVLAVEEYSRMVTKGSTWTVVTETDGSGNNFLTSDPLSIMTSTGLVNDVDFMIGHTDEEAFSLYGFFEAKVMANYQKYTQLFSPKRIMDNVKPTENLDYADEIKSDYFGTSPVNNATTRQLLTYLSDCNFKYDVQKFAQLAADSDNARYFYQFSAASGRNYYGNRSRNRYNITGAGHLDDVFYLFDPKALSLTITPNSTEYRLVKRFTTLITNFVKYGDPTPDWKTDSILGALEWPQYNTDDEAPYLDFGTNAITTNTGLDSVALGYFDALYERANVGYGSDGFSSASSKVKTNIASKKSAKVVAGSNTNTTKSA